MLTPPEAFGTVESGIYRCAAIDPFHFAFLDTLGLRSIIVLNLNRPPKVVRAYAADRNVDLVHMGLRPWRSSSIDEWMVLSHELIMDSLTFVLDTRNHPVLVLDATNSFIGTLRKSQHWNFSSVLSEYRAFSGGKPHYMTELFLELLDIKCMEHTEALRRRQSIEGMAHAAAAAAAAAVAAGIVTGQPSGAAVERTFNSPFSTSSGPSSAAVSPSPSHAILSISQSNLPLSSSSSSSLMAAAAATSSPSGIATPRSTSFSNTNITGGSAIANLSAMVSSSSSPVLSMSREHYSNVISRGNSAVYDYDESNSYPGGHSRQGHVVVLLPPTEFLPDWFRRQQALWDRDRQKRKQEIRKVREEHILEQRLAAASISASSIASGPQPSSLAMERTPTSGR